MTYSEIKRRMLLRLLDRVCEVLTKADCTRKELRQGNLSQSSYSPHYVFQHKHGPPGGCWSVFQIDQFTIQQGVDSTIMTLRMIREIKRRAL